jgi:Cu-Zn family superoxide dismutase
MAKRRTIVAAVALAGVTALGSCSSAPAVEQDPQPQAGAELQDTDGRGVGQLQVTGTDDGKVRVEITATDQEPGFHGLHFHERGLCEPESPDDEGMIGAFLSAGGHFAREGEPHGEHAGDLPSLYVNDDGTAQLSVTVDSFTVDDLLAGDGTAILIHQKADNFANIPDRYTSSESGEPGPDAETLETGDSGDRVACGVVGER